ncbi:hypothetical protein [Campylobacter rectus]|jgi:hypothetical protein|uniref:hypothetical protein n=2 Tax=Campylobacter TaxID=194 RepID=UPI0023F24319|nr:hypothetical protein [Campylobacter rectus]
MQVADIRSRINCDLVKKIFSNANNAKEFLKRLNINTKGMDSRKIFNSIVINWNYEKALPIVRDIFKSSPKFKRGQSGSATIEILLREWRELGFGDIAWPFSQGAFDNFVQSINSESSSRIEKDEKVRIAAVKYRRIKEINTERNDFLESLIFLKNENIIPTLSNSRGVDFFINGISFDQKVSRSVTNEFKRDFGDCWREIAVNNPAKVAQYLYEYQDEGRFGYSPRLFIVYLDENISPLEAKNTIENINLDKPLDISFTYRHKVKGETAYKTQAFVVLLGAQ